MTFTSSATAGRASSFPVPSPDARFEPCLRSVVYQAGGGGGRNGGAS